MNTKKSHRGDLLQILMRDAKLCEIGEGSSQVQRVIIAKKLLDF